MSSVEAMEAKILNEFVSSLVVYINMRLLFFNTKPRRRKIFAPELMLIDNLRISINIIWYEPRRILADLCNKIYLTSAAQARPSPQTPRYSSISRHCWLYRCWQWVFTCISYSYSASMFTRKRNKELVQVRLCVVCMCTHGWKNFKRHIQLV